MKKSIKYILFCAGAMFLAQAGFTSCSKWTEPEALDYTEPAPVGKVEAIKEGGNVIGNKTRVKVVKNKVAPPFREAYFDIMYGEGISKWGELVDLAVQMDIIQKSGSWFSMGDERIGQGKDSVKSFLMNNPDIAEEVEAKVREQLLTSSGSRAAARAAERPVAVSADDFNDED